MAETIVPFSGGHEAHEPRVDPSVVELAEELLELARAGQICGLYAFCTKVGGVIYTNRAGVCCSTGLIGKFQIASTDLCNLILESED